MQLSNIDEINAQYRNIYIQPHFDDAALSCGGSIALQRAAGMRVLVITVFGGVSPQSALSTFATQTLQRMGLSLDPSAAVQQRRAEDADALAVLGADTLWLDFPDAIYRGTPPYYPSEETLFGSVHSGDLGIEEQLATVLGTIHERAPLAVLYAPLGIGHHVDHQLCCSAADRLTQQRASVKFYEDFPYVARPNALAGRQQELGIPMEPEMVEISGMIRAKEEAIARYRSQVPGLFQTEDGMRHAIREYSMSLRRAHPGIQIERFWRW